MVGDDIAPDSALVERLRMAQAAIESVRDLVSMRGHLPYRALTELLDHAGGVIVEMQTSAQPDDEINAKYRSRMHSEYIGTFSDVMFYPYDAHVAEVRHLDIMQGLAHECRFAGQIPRFLSVAEHSIKVAAVAEHLAQQLVRDGGMGDDHVAVVALYALLHDAHEAYLKDMPSPLEARMCDVYGKPWRQIKQELQDVIHAAYNLPVLFEEGAQIIKQADKYVCHCEVLALRPNADAIDYGPTPPVDVFPIAKVSIGEPDISVVRSLLHDEVVRLCGVVGAQVPAGPQIAEQAVLKCAVPGCDSWSDAESGTLCTRHATPSKRLADIMRDRPIPGERSPQLPPRPSREREFIPKLSRPPRASDATTESWRSAVQSSQVDIPKRLLEEPEFRDEMD